MEANTRDVFNLIIQKLKATQRERLILYKFFIGLREELKPKISFEKIKFKAIWRFYKIVEISPESAKYLLTDNRDERWFDTEVSKTLRGIVFPTLPDMGMVEETEEEKKKKKKKKCRKDSPLPVALANNKGGIIVPLTTTVSTGQVPSLGPTNVFAEDMSVLDALELLSQINRQGL